MKSSNHSVSRIHNALCYSMQGLKKAWYSSPAFREECILVFCLTPVALWLNITIMQKLWLIFTMNLVLVVELLNSAIESTVDRIGTEHHSLSGQAKDMGSAAVFLSIILTLISWIIILCG